MDVVLTRSKVAAIRTDSGMVLNCPCGAQPATKTYQHGRIDERVHCECGRVYYPDGWLVRGEVLS